MKYLVQRKQIFSITKMKYLVPRKRNVALFSIAKMKRRVPKFPLGTSHGGVRTILEEEETDEQEKDDVDLLGATGTRASSAIV